MFNKSNEWKFETWNAVTGCTYASEACANCYARTMAKKFQKMGVEKYRNGFNITFHEDSLLVPAKWKTPRLIFANSMTDLFHDDIPFHYVMNIINTMINVAPQHMYIVLTKRPLRMLEFFEWSHLIGQDPLPNVWFGVTAENQKRADERIPLLLKIPAIVRFINSEPLLGSLNLSKYLDTGLIHHVACAGETSCRHPRQTKYEWVTSLRDQSVSRSIPFSFRGWGGVGSHSQSLENCLIDGVKWDQRPSILDNYSVNQ